MDLASAVLAASVSGITVYSDKSEYDVGESVNANWVIPSDSSGTDSLLKVITPFGTTAISNVTASTDSVINTDDFNEGTYTIRVENGQYYGEKSILFLPSAPDDEVVVSEQTTSDSIVAAATSDSCDSDSTISTILSSSSYSKG